MSRAALFAPAVAVALLGVASCAGSRNKGHSGSLRVGADGASVRDAERADASTAQSEVPDTTTLASDGARLAPSMREIARLDPAPPRSGDLLDSVTADTCVRVSFAAGRPVRVRLVDREGATRGDPFEGTRGAVPPLGPACAVRGDPLALVVEPIERDAPAVLVRAVIWASP